MQTEALQEADSRRKNQCSCKGKRQSMVVGLLFALIICTQERSKKKMAAPALVTPTANSSVRDDGIFATKLMAVTERSAAR